MEKTAMPLKGQLERLLGLILVLAVIAVYWQVQKHEFIYFDDPSYVTGNSHVLKGLTIEGLAWAMHTFHASNWHPLTWISHMMDCQLYGLNPAGHHLTSLFFHVANSLLLFLVLRESTGLLWRSFLVAALFALHPAHVESVAWVSERKDVISAFFWILTMLLYVRYVKDGRRFLLFIALLLYALGLMAKPMLVTLPFVLILIDYWPLGRIGTSEVPETGRISSSVSVQYRLVLEKLPFFLLSGASCVVTYVAQSQGRAIQSLGSVPLNSRIVNALVSYTLYMEKMLWAGGLAIFYPHPGDSLGWGAGAASGLFLGIISVAVFRQGRRRPYLPVGWLWFLGSLVPVIGVVQVGMQAMADRYTYIPYVGLFVMAVWGLGDFFKRCRVRRCLVTFLVLAVFSMLTVATWSQLGYWHDTASLFRHALDTTTDNYAAHFVLARAEGEHGAMDRAMFHYRRAVEINPAFVAMMHNRLGYDLAREGKLEEAVGQFEGALKVRPDYANAHNNLGVLLARKGRLDEAIFHLSEALRLRPGYEKARENLLNARRDKETKREARRKK